MFESVDGRTHRQTLALVSSYISSHCEPSAQFSSNIWCKNQTKQPARHKNPAKIQYFYLVCFAFPLGLLICVRIQSIKQSLQKHADLLVKTSKISI